MTDTPIPARGPGHCDDDDAWANFVQQYDGQPRSRPDLTDFALANAVFMADRNDLDLIVYQTAAKERIRWLSIELAKALEKIPAPGVNVAMVQHKIDAANPNDRRVYVNNQQWAKVYGFDPGMAKARADQIARALILEKDHADDIQASAEGLYQRDLLARSLGQVLVKAGVIQADAAPNGAELLAAAALFCAEPAADLIAIPPAPWPAGGPDNANAKRAGWDAYFQGWSCEGCPFPRDSADLHRDYRVGWDAALGYQMEHQS